MTSSPTVLSLYLPWPPSLNHYWRRVGAQTLISREGRRYRDEVRGQLMVQRPGQANGRLRVSIDAYPPDRRARDLDNLLKSLLDAMEHAGVYQSDSQIDDLRIVRRERRPGGGVQVTLQEISFG